MFLTKKSNAKKKIVIFGQYKSGTTGLFYKLKNSLPNNTRTLLEPKTYRQEKRDQDRYVLAKVILGVDGKSHRIKYKTFMNFDKKIYLIRDPRDWIVSGTLFVIQHEPGLYEDESKLNHIIGLLQEKEHDPQSIPVYKILEQILAFIPNQSMEKTKEWIIRQNEWLFWFEEQLDDYFLLKYEDFVDRRITRLEDYLGIFLNGEAVVDPAQSHVVRTKSYGNWRNWFLDADVNYFKPLLDGYIHRYGYSKDWSLNSKQVILPEHCSEYVIRTIKKKKGPLYEQYVLEKALAQQLREASKQERRSLYSQTYDDFFLGLPSERIQELKQSHEAQRQQVKLQSILLEPFLTKSTTFLEIGSGDCALSLHLAQRVHQVFAVEASKIITQNLKPPANFHLISSDTPPYNLPEEGIDLAFSCHFIEHLHPEDAYEHVSEIQRILTPGGCYICVTPNRLLGPHDISRFFDKQEPNGLHLKEYSHSELAALMKKGGFFEVKALHGVGRAPSKISIFPYKLIESVVARMSLPIRRFALGFGKNPPFRRLEQVILIATK